MYLEIQKPDGTKKLIELSPGFYSIGSDEENKIALNGTGVSGRHMIVSLRDGACWVEDLTFGDTLIDGAVVHGRAEVMDGQVLQVGVFKLKFFSSRPVPIRVEAPALTPPPVSTVPTPAVTPVASVPAPGVPGEERDEQLVARRQAVKQQIHKELLERMDIKRLTATHINEGDLNRRVLATVEGIVKDVAQRLPADISASSLIKEVYDEAVGLGAIEDLLADPDVTEIMVNGPHHIYVERRGRIELTDRTFLDEKSVLAVIERIVAPLGRRIDESQPYVDARLRDGSRVNAIIHPLSLIGPCLTIRKFSKIPMTDDDLIRYGTWTSEVRDFLKACIEARKNIIVAGGTGSGKTTLLNVLSSFLPAHERILTIEDAAELQLKQTHVVSLESRPPNIEGKGAVTIRDLVRNALRMRPDRIVVGECRGGEALDMLQAMNTGHDGSLTTIHANTPRDVISRMETLVLMSGMDLPIRAIREQITSAVDLIVHESRMSDGSRKVVNVTEVVGSEGERTTMQDIFVFEQTGLGAEGKVLGRIVPTGAIPTFLDDLKARGVMVDLAIFNPHRNG
ncbi:MAG: ATPase, T2SS/T4P/T4SS family [bacterium]|jgi:pilus assembly protein CpaF